MEPTGNVCATHHSQHACVITHMPLTKAFRQDRCVINGVRRAAWRNFQEIKIVETDMMAIYRVMMQVIIPARATSVGNGNRPSGLPGASQPKGIKLTQGSTAGH